MGKWYKDVFQDNDVVISSRIRLARNLSGYCFPPRLNDEDAARLVNELRSLTGEIERRDDMKYYSCNVDRLKDIDKASLVELHTVSPALAGKKQSTGLILSDDESISIMLNEEDHIRIQAVTGGLNMKRAQKDANRIDDYLDSMLKFAYHPKYGYLTSCPTNVGTGLRASCMLFLPGLTMQGKLECLSEEISKYGVVIRGIYGEGTKSAGFVYQVSNQKTLGCSEPEILDNMEQIIAQIMLHERKQRENLLANAREDIEDKIYRSYGVLKFAKKLTTADAMLLLAQLKFGSDTGLIRLKGIELLNIHWLMMEIQPASLQKIAGRELGKNERDAFRAEYLNKSIPELLNESQSNTKK